MLLSTFNKKGYNFVYDNSSKKILAVTATESES